MVKNIPPARTGRPSMHHVNGVLEDSRLARLRAPAFPTAHFSALHPRLLIFDFLRVDRALKSVSSRVSFSFLAEYTLKPEY
jgi:hypothetical protein